jgi:aminoglycoside phosphotransferase (APT) family kinase protein
MNATQEQKPYGSIEKLVVSIARSLYKATPQIVNYRGRDNAVWGLQFGDRRGNRVIKIGASRPTLLLREQQVMQKLKMWGLEVAEIEFTQRDLPNIWIPFMIMPEVADRTIAEICVDDAEFAPSACRRTGEFLAHLYQLPENAIDIEPSFSLAADGVIDNLNPAAIDLGQWQNVVAQFDSCQELRDAFAQFTPIFQQLRPIIENGDYKSVTHRDFLPSQILVSEKKYGVIDWEYAASGRILRDLGDFIGGMRRFGGNNVARIRDLIYGFGSIQPLSAIELQEITLWETFSMLREVTIRIEQGRIDRAKYYFQMAEAPSLLDRL